LHRAQRLVAVLGERDVVSFEPQRPLQRDTERRLVVDDQDAHRRSLASAPEKLLKDAVRRA
jgi:hypothetical protein